MLQLGVVNADSLKGDVNEDGITVYKNIMPKSKRHITRELLLEAEKGLEIIYQYLY